ncbi:MAG: TonB-dependent receptor domain-containing protein, partial [bacterium]
HILTQITQDSVSNVGSHKSRGVELATSLYLSRNWQASANVAYVDAAYGDFVNPDFGISATGNRPPNVAKWTGNVWMGVNRIAGLPLEIGGGVRYVADRFADYGNQVTLKSYVLVNAYAAYMIGRTRLMLRARNLTNEEYIPWVSPFYPNQLALGSPRFVEFSVEVKF